MTPDQAAKLLDLPTDASPEQLEARFNELRRKLEDKIARAPTPGLQAKYREALADITTAFETLTLAADSSSLPVIQLRGAGSKEQGAQSPRSDDPSSGRAPGSPLHAPSSTRRKSGGKEFAIVALLAAALLGAGGWFVMKTRAENAEQARIAAEQQRLAAEALQVKQAAEQAEAGRVNALKTSLRTKLAEARVDWEAYESNLQDAERRASDLKSELRGLREAPETKKAELSAQVTAQELYNTWLKGYLLRHPAKLARVRAEELLQAGAPDEAAAVVGEITAALQILAEDIAHRRKYFFETTASLRLHSKPEGVRWILTDAYGRTQEGVTPARVEGLPLTHLVADGVAVAPYTGVEKRGEFTTGKVTIRFVRTGWPEVVREGTAVDDLNPVYEAEFPEGAVAVSSLPSGVPFKVTQILKDYGWTATGTTPATLTGVPVGRVRVTLTRPGYGDVFQNLDVAAGQTAKTTDIDQRSQPVRIKVAEAARIFVDGKLAGTQEAEVGNLTPGEHALQLEATGYRPYRAKFTVKQQSTPVNLSYSFKELAVENITCSPCSGRGSFTRHERCTSCSGRGTATCSNCSGRGANFMKLFADQPAIRIGCGSCNQSGKVDCDSCNGRGQHTYTNPCTTCGGDGRVSKLQLSP